MSINYHAVYAEPFYGSAIGNYNLVIGCNAYVDNATESSLNRGITPANFVLINSVNQTELKIGHIFFNYEAKGIMSYDNNNMTTINFSGNLNVFQSIAAATTDGSTSAGHIESLEGTAPVNIVVNIINQGDTSKGECNIIVDQFDLSVGTLGRCTDLYIRNEDLPKVNVCTIAPQ